MSGNGGGCCFNVMVTVSDTAVLSLHDGTKGPCKLGSTPTLKSVTELRKSMTQE